MLTYADKYAMACALNNTHDEMIKKALDWSDAATVGEIAAGAFIPGVGSAISLKDAYKSFRAGNKWEGLGHVGLAGVGLIPGIGGSASRLIRYGAKPLITAGKWLSKGKSVIGGPGMSLAKPLNMAARGITRAANGLESVQKGIGSIGNTAPMKSFAKTRAGRILGSTAGMNIGYGAANVGIGLPNTMEAADKAEGAGDAGMFNSLKNMIPSGGYQNPMDIKPPGGNNMAFNPTFNPSANSSSGAGNSSYV